MKLPSLLLALSSTACTAAGPAPATASTPLTEATREYLLGPGSLAVRGWDVVSYFPEGGGEPAQGDPGIRAERDGVVYHFATPEHRRLFLADPDRYEPAYGGWCATAMAEGEKVTVDPRNYLVADGRLFLFYESFWADALRKWNEDPDGNEIAADEHWREISGEEPRKPEG